MTISNPITVPNAVGTYYYGACVDPVTNESDPSNNCSSALRVVVSTPPDPELVVTNMMASKTIVAPSNTITLTATVWNTGGPSTATTLRWYRSTDSTITTADTPVGTSAINNLAAGATLTISNPIPVTNAVGTYYYGACVDPVAEESDPSNNCSSAVRVVVSIPELMVTNMGASSALVAPSAMLTLTATVWNTGGVSPTTTLRWYRSTNGAIDTNDTLVASNAVGILTAGATVPISNTITVTSTTNTYYYYACVDPVAGESDPSNNCSSTVTVVVSSPSAGARLEAFDFNNLSNAGNNTPNDFWSDGTTMWVVDTRDDKIYAYKMSDRTPDPSKDFTLAAGNFNSRGIWSDGTTIWVSDDGDDKIYAYNLASRVHIPAKDLTLAAENDSSQGIWSDGTTLWVMNAGIGTGNKLYAYGLASKTHIPAKDLTLTAGNFNPRGIWSDGTTLWVADSTSGTSPKLFAYKLSDRTRDSDKDLTLTTEHTFPRGLWSDGNTMWVADIGIDKIYAYDARGLVNQSTLATVRAGLDQIARFSRPHRPHPERQHEHRSYL